MVLMKNFSTPINIESCNRSDAAGELRIVAKSNEHSNYINEHMDTAAFNTPLSSTTNESNNKELIRLL